MKTPDPSTPKSEVKRLTNWIVSNGRLAGTLVGTDKDIRTSAIVAREGKVVTTHSGSRYELVDPPHPYMTDVSMLRAHWHATSGLDAIDVAIARIADFCR
jgi:hypothetical protein